MDACVYCGETATDRDHVIPVSSKASSRHYDCETVPSCRQCNNWLGARYLITVEDRTAYIAGRLAAALAKLKMVDWTPEEIDELGPRLKSKIKRGLAKRRRLISRLAFAQGSFE